MSRLRLALGSVVTLAGFLACGSFGTAPSATAPGAEGGVESGLAEGSVEGGAVPDGAIPPVPTRRCVAGSLTKPPKSLMVPGYAVEAARFSVDGKTAYLSLCPMPTKTSCELFTAPVDATGSIGMPTPYPLNVSGVYDSNLMLSPDGRVAVFASGRLAPGTELFTATYDANKLGTPVTLGLPLKPSKMVYANEPYLLRDGKTLYFAAADSTSTDWDIFRSSGAPPDYSSATATLAGGDSVNSGNEEVTPVVTEDEEEIFFASNRTGAQGPLDIWTALKTPGALPGTYGHADAVTELNTGGIEYPTWISPDACTLYFIRKSSAGTADGTLWVASRQ